MNGKIVGIKYGVYFVDTENGIIESTARGLFRIKNIKPLVGDEVVLNEYKQIVEIKNRKSELIRPAISNIDQMLIVTSLKEPEFSYHLCFKYLTYANLNNIPCSIIVTKIDLIDDKHLIKEIKTTFDSVDVPVYFVSNKSKQGLSDVDMLFQNKVTCLMGQTGVGKSSLLNYIDPNYKREIGEYSEVLHRGKHQTKEVMLLPFKNGYIADTPGFSSLDLKIFVEDLSKYFPKINKISKECYFNDCVHLNESNCAVKKALETKDLLPIVYDCYVKLCNESIYRKERFKK